MVSPLIRCSKRVQTNNKNGGFKLMFQQKRKLIMKLKPVVFDGASWVFGSTVFIVGVINTFWGNDPFFGVFIFVLSFVYFPPANALLKKTTGFSIHFLTKIGLAIFIFVATLGVGELFDKIELMLMDL